MATMVVLNGKHRGEWYTVPATPTGLVVGRGENLIAEIVDPRVSREHLRVAWSDEAGAYVAEDLDSHNGTKVNGRTCTTRPLKDGDTILLGHTLLAFTEQEFADQGEVDPFVEDMRSHHQATLKQFEEREKYTEAAALFSRLFRRKR